MVNFLRKYFRRTFFMLIMIVLEALFLAAIFRWFRAEAAWIAIVLRILSIFIVLTIVNTSKHLSNDMLYILVIMISPVFGTALYLLLGANLFTSRTFFNLLNSTLRNSKYYKKDEALLDELKEKYPSDKGIFHYMQKSAGFPWYRNVTASYYPFGDEGYPVMLEELKKAEKFIFIEYFIIEEGQMWNGIMEILEEKVRQGVDVRVMYDDLGSFFTLTGQYAQQLEEKGIKCIPFNRINPLLNIIINHRDHRKIMVIDGKTAFSGGVNLADEYINVKHLYGHWKDNIIKITGEAVWSYTVMFLTHWNAFRNDDPDFTVFKCSDPVEHETDGYIAPYAETPLGNERTAQNIYFNILDKANDYCYIYTPYLIIDTDFINTLVLAAKRGVDVRLVTPGIPDKKIVYMITQSFYYPLVEGGVRIFEYSPGFVHSKVFVSDDKVATVGTVNMDYRSLYLHFENGTCFYDCSVIKDVKQDFTDAFEVSREITKDKTRHGIIRTFIVSVLKLFASLM